MAREKAFTVRIFDGTNTTIYTTRGFSKSERENQIVKYHIALGGKVVKVTTTENRG